MVMPGGTEGQPGRWFTGPGTRATVPDHTRGTGPSMDHDTRNAPLLFISDLHLDPSRPAMVRLFLHFLARARGEAQALYILGDLFEAWIGDDAVGPEEPALAGLRAFAAAGPGLYVMRGNRDFLMGEDFARMTGATLLPDPTVIGVDGEAVLLMHGDTLCTDDQDYQRFRAMVRDPHWQRQFLSLSVPERIEQARRARSESTGRNSVLEDYLMDVNPGAVEQAMQAHGVRTLVHGHTHRPAVHDLLLDGRRARRIVLGDWYDQGSVLRWSDGEATLQSLGPQD